MNAEHFTIAAYPTLIWRVVQRLNLGGWPSLRGATLDGRRYTLEREIDVAFCSLARAPKTSPLEHCNSGDCLDITMH